MKYLIVFIVSFCSLGTLMAQTYFTGTATDYIRDNDLYSHVGLAIADLNGDGKDDIVGIDREGYLVVYYQMTGGEKYLRKATGIRASNPWSIIVGDINNDGPPEIILNTLQAMIVAEQMPDMTYQRIARKSLTGIYPQSASLGDFNLDGKNEIFLCNDDGVNKIYQYIDGELVELTDYDLTTLEESNNSGNYGSVMSDLNGDGRLDIYVAKCSVFVPDDATDPRRRNQMFLSTEQGLHQVQDSILNDGAQSWSVDTGDIDNDGDLDIFYTNHGSPHTLLINDEGSFVQSSAFFKGSNAIQSVIIDIDLDGWNDIVISSGTLVEIYYNQGNEEFIYQSLPVEGTGIFSMTIGDLNGDNFPDVFGSKSNDNPFNEFNGRDRIGINTPTAMHRNYLKILLDESGPICGSKIKLYSSDSPVPYQLKEVKCGHSYGITTSAGMIFGGVMADVDSIVVDWYGGASVRYLVPDSIEMQGLRLYQDGHVEQHLEEVVYLCEGYATLEGFDESSIWSTGQVSDDIIVDAPGIFTVAYTGGDTVTVRKKHYYVYDKALKDIDLINESGMVYLCDGEEIVLSKTEFPGEYSWYTGAQVPEISITEPGVYTLSVKDDCTEAVIYDTVKVVNANLPDALQDTVIFDNPGYYQFPVTGKDVRWFVGDTVIYNDTYSGEFPIGETVLMYDTHIDSVGEAASYGLEDVSKTFTFNEINSGLYLRVDHACVMYSVEVYGEVSGLRRILLQDLEGTVVLNKPVWIDTGHQVIDLDFRIEEPGHYYLTTDIATNEVELGHAGPGLSRTTDVDFPIEGEVMDVLYSGNGEIFYPYFYNIQVSELKYHCRSPIHTIVVIVKMLDHVEEAKNYDFSIYPNPGLGNFMLHSIEAIEAVVVMDGLGQPVNYRKDANMIFLDVPPGIYFIKVQFSNSRVAYKKIIMR